MIKPIGHRYACGCIEGYSFCPFHDCKSTQEEKGDPKWFHKNFLDRKLKMRGKPDGIS